MYSGLSMLVFVGRVLLLAGRGLVFVGGVLLLCGGILLFAAPLRKISVSCLLQKAVKLVTVFGNRICTDFTLFEDLSVGDPSSPVQLWQFQRWRKCYVSAPGSVCLLCQAQLLTQHSCCPKLNIFVQVFQLWLGANAFSISHVLI